MKLFTEHPQSVGESYLQHMHSALTFSGRLFTATLCCLVHGLLPFLFKSTGSTIIADLHNRMIANRTRAQ